MAYTYAVLPKTHAMVYNFKIFKKQAHCVDGFGKQPKFFNFVVGIGVLVLCMVLVYAMAP
jgi:hypothetical protein